MLDGRAVAERGQRLRAQVCTKMEDFMCFRCAYCGSVRRSQNPIGDRKDAGSSRMRVADTQTDLLVKCRVGVEVRIKNMIQHGLSTRQQLVLGVRRVMHEIRVLHPLAQQIVIEGMSTHPVTSLKAQSGEPHARRS